MKERSRDVAIGLTVLGALVLLAAMIVIFAGVPQILQGGYRVRILMDGTYDMHEGDSIHLRGLRVGRVTRIAFTEDDPARGVTLTAHVNHGIDLPGNTKAYIYTKGFVGGAYMELKPEGAAGINPRTGRPYETLPTDGSAVMEGRQRGMDLLPEDLTRDLRATMEAIGSLARNLNEAIAPSPPEAPPTTGSAPATASAPAPAGLRTTMAKLDAALQSVTTILGDPQNQANFKESLANLTQATSKASEAMQALKDFAAQASSTVQDVGAQAGKTMEKFADLAVKLIEAADTMSGVMTALNQAVAKINAGEGTVGKLVSDPKLYNDLVAATEQLTELMKEMRQMVMKWDKQGLPLKLK